MRLYALYEGYMKVDSDQFFIAFAKTDVIFHVIVHLNAYGRCECVNMSYQALVKILVLKLQEI